MFLYYDLASRYILVELLINTTLKNIIFAICLHNYHTILSFKYISGFNV